MYNLENEKHSQDNSQRYCTFLKDAESIPSQTQAQQEAADGHADLNVTSPTSIMFCQTLLL